MSISRETKFGLEIFIAVLIVVLLSIEPIIVMRKSIEFNNNVNLRLDNIERNEEMILSLFSKKPRLQVANDIAKKLSGKLPDCSSDNIARMSLAIVDTCNRYPDQLSPEIILSLIQQESSYDPNAVSAAGAIGLMQVMPDTARPILYRMGYTSDVDILYRPEVNVAVGLDHIQTLCEEFSDTASVLDAYFWGSRAFRVLQKNNPNVIAEVGYSKQIMARISSVSGA